MEKHIVSIEIGGEKEEIMVGNDGRGWFAIEASWGMHDLNNIPDLWLRKTKALAVEYYLERRRDELIGEDSDEDIKVVNESLYKLRRERLGHMSKKRIEGIAVSPDLYPEYFEWLSTEIDRLKSAIRNRDKEIKRLEAVIVDKDKEIERLKRAIIDQDVELVAEQAHNKTLMAKEAKIEWLEAENDRLKQRNEELGVVVGSRSRVYNIRKEAERLKAVIKDKGKEIKRLEAEIDRLKGSIGWNSLLNMQPEISKLSWSDIREIKAEIENRDKEIERKDKEVERLKAENDRLKQRVKWLEAGGDR